MWKTSEKIEFSHVFRTLFHSALMEFDNIANRRVGGEPTDKSASFSYTSLFGRINTQILNVNDYLHSKKLLFTQ